MSTRDLINAIAAGDAIEIENAFNSVMAEKVSARIEDMRVDVAQNLFAEQQTEELEEVELNLEDYSLEEIEQFMQTEEFEQLDELSKDKLGWYLKKASSHMDKKGENMIKRDKKFNPGTNKLTRQIGGLSQRQDSIATASKKYLAKEETEQ